MSRPVYGHKYAQAFVEEDKRYTALYSYSTCVIYIDEDGWMKVYGLYSPTTRKHIGWFMKELGLDYSLAKSCYLNEKEYNIYTGEMRDEIYNK